MNLEAKVSPEIAQLALRLVRLEEELRAFRDLHEQELRPLERRIEDLRATLARHVETEPAASGER